MKMPMEWGPDDDVLSANHHTTESVRASPHRPTPSSYNHRRFLTGAHDMDYAGMMVSRRVSEHNKITVGNRSPSLSLHHATDVLDQIKRSPQREFSPRPSPEMDFLSVHPYKSPYPKDNSPSPSSQSTCSSQEPHHPGERSPMSFADLGEACQVCGQRASGNFFGALVCLPCKSFFIRCTKDGEPAFVLQCEGRCDVSRQGRNRCQPCRYARCLDAGMTRKEKPEAIEPGEGQLLCRVCGDIANGIHFGVYTCEGCKKFFRRGLLEYQGYVCKGAMDCVLNPRNRNNCRYCRFQKCLCVGMSRGAIKMGRPKKVVKDNDYLSPRKLNQGPVTGGSDSDSVDLPSVNAVRAFSEIHMGTTSSSESSSSLGEERPESAEYLQYLDSYGSGYLPLKKCILRSLLNKEEAMAQAAKAKAIQNSDKFTHDREGNFRYAMVDESPQDLSPCGRITMNIPASTHWPQRASPSPEYPMIHHRRHARSRSHSPTSFLVKRNHSPKEDDPPKVKRRRSDNDSPYFLLGPFGNDSLAVGQDTNTTSDNISQHRMSERRGRCYGMPSHPIAHAQTLSQLPPAQVSSDAAYAQDNASLPGTFRCDNTVSKEHGFREFGGNSRSSPTVAQTESQKSCFTPTHVVEQTTPTHVAEQTTPTHVTGSVVKQTTSAAAADDESDPPLPFSSLILIKRSILNDVDSLFLHALSLLESIQGKEASRTKECKPNVGEPLTGSAPGHDTSVIPPEYQKTTDRLINECKFSPVKVCKYWSSIKLPSRSHDMSSEHHGVLMRMLEAYMMMLKNLDEGHMPPQQSYSNITEWPSTECPPILEHVVKRILKQVKEELAFMCKVPGFNDFHPKDRRFIIQNMCYANVTLMAARDWYNPETDTFRNFMTWELREGHPMYRFRINARKLTKLVQDIKMDRVEAAMMSALNVAASDFLDLENPGIIEETRGRLTAALAAHLTGKGVDAELRMKELFRLMPAFRVCGFWTKRHREEIALNRENLSDRKVDVEGL